MRDKAVFTTFEAAKLCHVSPLSIINWVNAGRLPAFRTPGGHRRIRREDLVRIMRDTGMPLPEELREDPEFGLQLCASIERLQSFVNSHGSADGPADGIREFLKPLH